MTDIVAPIRSGRVWNRKYVKQWLPPLSEESLKDVTESQVLS